MGWKSSMIIISDSDNENYEDVLKSIGLSGYEEAGEELFEEAVDPIENTLYIGKYGGNLIITGEEITFECLQPDISNIEKKLLEIFPDSEICALSLHSVVNHWGYSVIKDKKKIRVRAGDSDSGTIIDFGEPLNEEEELFSHAKVGADGNRIYELDEFPDEPMTEDQVGEEFVFEISKRYFGERLDSFDEIFETNFKAFSYSKKQAKKKTKKKWWEFWKG